MWWTIAALAQAPLEMAPIEGPPAAEAETCRVTGRVDRRGAFAVRDVAGCRDDAAARVRAGLVPWTWVLKEPGLIGIFVRAPAHGDPATPDRLPPHAGLYLELQKQVVPTRATASLASCTVWILIQTNGVPDTAVVAGCPSGSFVAAAEAALQWRWFPPQMPDGTPVRAQTRIEMSFASR